MGPLFAASIKEQFVRLRDADWWYYENGAKNKLYSEDEIAEIRKTSKLKACAVVAINAASGVLEKLQNGLVMLMPPWQGQQCCPKGQCLEPLGAAYCRQPVSNSRCIQCAPMKSKRWSLFVCMHTSPLSTPCRQVCVTS